MSTPLEFLYHFRDLLRGEGIRFAITSGMACVYYGLQQNTKDSDWIIEPEDLPKLHDLLLRHERRAPPWHISYRTIFGAPLTTEFLAAGWTSHLAVQDQAGSAAQHVDFFGKAPRVVSWTIDSEGFAVRDVVAMMKRTDRDKDWPIVDGLGRQFAEDANFSPALVHLRDVELLRSVWVQASATEKEAALARRPLLQRLDGVAVDTELDGWLRLERLVWECVNRERHGLYQRAWKEFYKAWRREEDWVWPTSESFSHQHRRVLEAAATYAFPVNPMAGRDRAEMVEVALARASAVSFVPIEEIRRVCPPLNELLPP